MYQKKETEGPLKEATSLYCVKNSVINAIYFLGGNEDATMAKAKMNEVHMKFKRLGNVGQFGRALDLRL